MKSDSGEELINLDCDGTICTNSWIVKPAQGARGIGHKIIASGDESGLQQIAQTCPMMQLEYKGDDVIGVSSFRQKPVDRIAQLLVTQPLLVMKRKFDLRLFVFVRSFVPFEGKKNVDIISTLLI